MTKKPDLDAAYDLKTPEDSVRLYRDWAQTYDTGFAVENDYLLHDHVARLYVETGGVAPVLDVGAGTGLCGQALRTRGIEAIDATDISPEMLEVARSKKVYGNLFVGDILAGLDAPNAKYAGAVSSGTFTLGHVGPEGLDDVLRVVKPGGHLAISISKKHYAKAGFDTKFAQLEPVIDDLLLTSVRHYGDKATGPHAKDEGFVATFRKR